MHLLMVGLFRLLVGDITWYILEESQGSNIPETVLFPYSQTSVPYMDLESYI